MNNKLSGQQNDVKMDQPHTQCTVCTVPLGRREVRLVPALHLGSGRYSMECQPQQKGNLCYYRAQYHIWLVYLSVYEV